MTDREIKYELIQAIVRNEEAWETSEGLLPAFIGIYDMLQWLLVLNSCKGVTDFGEAYDTIVEVYNNVKVTPREIDVTREEFLTNVDTFYINTNKDRAVKSTDHLNRHSKMLRKQLTVDSEGFELNPVIFKWEYHIKRGNNLIVCAENVKDGVVRGIDIFAYKNGDTQPTTTYETTKTFQENRQGSKLFVRTITTIFKGLVN